MKNSDSNKVMQRAAFDADGGETYDENSLFANRCSPFAYGIQLSLASYQSTFRARIGA